MTDQQAPEPPATLAYRLSAIEGLEDELMRRASSRMSVGSSIYRSDMFILGATRRTLAQSKGFRDLIGARNFPCAAAILRLQIDTAMRINALTFVADADELCGEVLGGKNFSQLKDEEGNTLSDAHLRRKLAELHPWINAVYQETSDFVHLSGRHFYTSIARLDHESRTMFMQISGTDPKRPDEDYFEVVDAFFGISKITSLLILGYFASRAAGEAQAPEN